MFGVAIGALVRNQVVGVIGMLVVAFVVLPLVQAASMTAVEVTQVGAAPASRARRCWRSRRPRHGC